MVIQPIHTVNMRVNLTNKNIYVEVGGDIFSPMLSMMYPYDKLEVALEVWKALIELQVKLQERNVDQEDAEE